MEEHAAKGRNPYSSGHYSLYSGRMLKIGVGASRNPLFIGQLFLLLRSVFKRNSPSRNPFIRAIIPTHWCRRFSLTLPVSQSLIHQGNYSYCIQEAWKYKNPKVAIPYSSGQLFYIFNHPFPFTSIVAIPYSSGHYSY